MKWESPRGPISIDPATRDIVQNVYIRRVEKVGNKIVNVEFDKVANVKDPHAQITAALRSYEFPDGAIARSPHPSYSRHIHSAHSRASGNRAL